MTQATLCFDYNCNAINVVIIRIDVYNELNVSYSLTQSKDQAYMILM